MRLRARGEARAVWLRLPAHVWATLEAACKEGRTSLGGLIAGLVLRYLGEDGGEEGETSDEEDPAPAPGWVGVRQDPRLSPEEEALELVRLREEALWVHTVQEPPFGVRLVRDHRGRLRPVPVSQKLG